MKTLTAFLLAAAACYPQALDLKHLERLADKAAESTNVTLDGALLQLGAKFLSAEKPDEARVKKLVAGLKAIYVKSFEFDKEGEYSEADIASVRNQLHAPEWSKIVDVRSRKGGDNAEIFIKTGGKDIGGLVIIASEPKELTIVNIVGRIDLDELSDLGGNFGIPKMEFQRTTKPPNKDDE
jgi:hypothetical protein